MCYLLHVVLSKPHFPPGNMGHTSRTQESVIIRCVPTNTNVHPVAIADVMLLH